MLYRLKVITCLWQPWSMHNGAMRWHLEYG